MRKKEKAQKLQAALRELYPTVSCSLDFQTPLELLAATCLSAQCTDERVNLVTKSLFARCRTAQDYRDIPQAKLEEIIRSCGFYRNKAKNLRALGLALCERHGGQVPSTMEELTALPGVGRKTANVILGTIFHDPGIVADTHCIRLSNRFGLVSSRDPLIVERELTPLIPKPERLDFCHRLIAHGRSVCLARAPRCRDCTLRDFCVYKEKNL